MAKAGSILAADFGSVHTRTVLIDIVDGEYRVVARDIGRTTLGTPVDDVGVGLHRLVSNIEEVTGRRLYSAADRLITPEDNQRNGVDTFITTASAGRPIRAVMVGLMPSFSLMTALRAISGAYIEPVVQIHLRDGWTEEDRLNALILGRPDLIFISGGTDGGAKTALLNILKTVHLAVRITDKMLRPLIVYAGNAHLNDAIQELFGELTTLLIAGNIRPDVQDETFESVLVELGKAYDQHREDHSESFRTVSDMSTSGILPTAQSYSIVADYYARTMKGNVLAVDMGSTSSVLVGVFGGQSSTRISTTKGLGHSAVTLLDEVSEAAVAAWLPFYPKPGEIRNYALNKTTRPAGIPMNIRDLYHEHALLRTGLRQMVKEARELWQEVETFGSLPPISTIVAGGGALTNTGHPAYNMMLIADCLQPIGVTQVKIDPHGVIPALGAAARFNPEAAVHLLEGDGLEHLGTLISFDGQPKLNKTVAKLKIKTSDGSKIDYELKGGRLLSLPLPQEFSLEIRIRTSGGHTVGGKRSLKLKVFGGTAGIVFDARGRVFEPPASVEDRAALMPQWASDATDDPLIEIPEAWLQKLETAQKDAASKKDPKKAAPIEEEMDLAALAGLDDEEEEDIFDLAEDDEEEAYEEEDDLDDDLGSLRDLL